MYPNGRYGEIGGVAMEVNTSGLAPTISTTGRLGDVRFDTSGNRWTLLKIDGSNYYWSPDGFPADNTEYVSHISGGLVVYKKTIVGTTPASAGSSTYAHGITNPVFVGEIQLLVILNNGDNVDKFYIAASSYAQPAVNETNLLLYIGNSVVYLSRPFRAILTYRKA